MSDSSSSGALGFFGAWQVLYLTLAWGVDAPWNKVQRWPMWDWWNYQSVMFPTMVGLLGLLILLIFLALASLVSEIF